MSTATIQPEQLEAPPPVPQPPPAARDLKVYAHSPLLFWWPVWVAAFAGALWTYLDGSQMVLVPAGSVVAEGQVTAPPGESIYASLVHVARSPIPGAIFATVLLGVVIFANMYLRGIWALFTTACLVALALLLSWGHWWDDLLRGLLSVQVYMNLATYMAIGTTVFIVWCLAFYVFDRRTYLVFSLSQVRVRDELGGEEKVFDTSAVAFEKRPFDWFRWVVGRGAGDLVVRVGGAHPQTFELANVVRASKWLVALEHRLRTRDVV